MYTHFVKAGRENEDLWECHTEWKAVVNLFEEAVAIWHGLLFAGLKSMWKDAGELEEKQWK